MNPQHTTKKTAVPIYNAAGSWCLQKDDLHALGKSQSDIILIKTATLKPRTGNPEPRIYWEENISVNSVGLANPGIDEMCTWVSELRQYSKPIHLSVAGFTAKEFEELVTKADKAGFDGIEVNLSCPNVEGKEMFSMDIEASRSVLHKVRTLTKKTLGVKLTFYPSRNQIEEWANLLIETKTDFAALANSYPLGLMIDRENETTRIHPNGGIGGLGGAPLKPMGLALVNLFYQHLRGKVQIVAVGGISSGEDVYDYVLAGASAMQIGTIILEQGIERAFYKIKEDLSRITTSKHLTDLSEKVGALQVIPPQQ